MSEPGAPTGPLLIDFGVLGPLLAVRDGDRLGLGGPRQRAVLALLLLQPNTVVSLDRLIDGVWDDAPPRAAVRTVQTYVFHLRRELEPDRAPGSAARLLTTAEPGYSLLLDPARIDSCRFQAALTAGRAAAEEGRPEEASRLLSGALALWRGPVLADLGGYGFVNAEAARLADLRLAAVESKLDADLALGRHDQVAAESNVWITREPLRERLYGIAMLSLYQSGRQADALGVYRRARTVLADDLGVDPGVELQQLHQAVLEHDRSLDPAPAPGLVVIPAQPMPERAARPADDAGSAPASTPPPAAKASSTTRRPFRAMALAAAAVLALVATAVVAYHYQPAPARGALQTTSNSVAVIDPASGRLLRTVPVGTDPGRIAAGAGAIWAANSQDATVSRIDPDTLAVTQTIAVGAGPTAVSVGAGSVWVAHTGERSVSRIDPATNQVVQTIPVGNGPVGVAATSAAVWVANRFDDSVSRLDPVTGRLVARITVGGAPTAITAAGSTVWVVNSADATAAAINAGTNAVSAPVGVGNGAQAVAWTGDSVWVANDLDGTVTRIDAGTGAVRTVEATGDDPAALAAAGDGVWVSNRLSGTVTRLAGRTGRVVQRIDVGDQPAGIALSGGRLWVSIGAAAGRSHRGGTLHVVSADYFPSIDPAMEYGPMMSVVYDGLLAMRKAGGSDGLTVVPDLATTVPRPTDGGRTYTFTLRPGIRYSDGRPVKASDITRGLERNLRGPLSIYYTGIVGSASCRSPAPRTRCDLSGGVAADDAAQTLAIRLSAPDPDFPARLALPFASAAAPGAPPGDTGRHPLPGTGPYRIERYTGADGTITLGRNPYFREWSRAAQPDGFPDHIVFEHRRDGAHRVETGQADLTDTQDRALLIRHRSQVRLSPGSLSFFMFLNPATPPFTDVRVRQAINYAVDRRAVLDRYGGDIGGRVSCQVLPPSFPGYQPRCGYTLAPGTTWSAPDLDRARGLIRASGTAGERIEVVTAQFLEPVAGYFVPLLNRLGYRAHLVVHNDNDYFSYLEHTHVQPQMGVYGWAADYPAAADYLAVLFGCHQHFTLVAHCQPDVDALIQRAADLETTNAAAADGAWSQVERAVVDAALVVPLFIGEQAQYVTPRVGNYLASPLAGPLYDQMWVR